jgi:succinoglycan biosynthesis transport protein ExoP
MTPLQILSILRRRAWIIVLAFISTLAGAGGIMLLVPPRYDAIATASIDPGQVDPVTGQSSAASAMVRIVQGNMVALAQSQRVATEVVKRLNLSRDPTMASAYTRSSSRGRMSVEEWIASEYLLKSVGAKFTEGTNVLSIKYKTRSPTQAALIANTFMAAFIDNAVELKTASAQQTARWFEPQMDKMQAELQVAREKLAKYQRENNVIAARDANDSENSQLVAVTNELSNARSQLVLLQSQTGNAAADARKNLSLLPDSPTLVAIKGNLATVNAEITKLRAEVGENNPKLLNLLATKRSLESQITTEVASRGKALQDQIVFLEKQRAEQLQRMISVQSRRDELNGLQREVDARQAQVDDATKVAGQARLQSRLSFANISILDNATPPGSAAFPKFLVVFALAIGAGLSLGVILALLAEAFDRRIRVSSDLEFAAGAPLLGTLLNVAPPRRRLASSATARLAARPAQALIGSSQEPRGWTPPSPEPKGWFGRKPSRKRRKAAWR